MSARLRATPWFRSEEEEEAARVSRRRRMNYHWPLPPLSLLFHPFTRAELFHLITRSAI